MPSRAEDTISQASHDLQQPQVQPPIQPQPSTVEVPVAEVTKEVVDQVDHKVTVSIHQAEEPSQTGPMTSMASMTSSEVSVGGSGGQQQGHVTVIKLEAASANAAPNVTIEQPSKKGENFPFLPAPPASRKTRVPHQAILQPTPASPPPPKQLPSVTSLTNKPSSHQTLQVIEDATSGTKSKSLPRGLPSDGSAFASFQQQPQPASVSFNFSRIHEKKPKMRRFESCEWSIL